MRCRSACQTRDHATLGECLRAANIHTGAVDAAVQRRWDAELSAYRSAREQGIQPDGTSLRQVRHALDVSDRTGRAYGQEHAHGQ